MFFLKPGNDVVQRGVISEFEAVPERPFSISVFVLLCSNGLRKTKERQGKVDEAVPVVIELALSTDDLGREALDDSKG
jgi:hypothetical protein